ncbi:signal transduction histidine kinase [Longilinea arvoryzae]|uniref:histidine kinase n=1 Tax=Longilinea arvoryzae TaxID=360412 RepID=A0A0S7BCQ6_9CHLR|nr:CHASE4 domain-containing protein [Longilinea arvoryzae]GAP15647.1 signal transduction histidine kinase [Longilinea arvoryzae]
MSLSRTTLVMIALAFLGLLAILLATMQTTLMNHFNTVEIGGTNESVRRALLMVENEQDSLVAMARTWAHNEEIYQFIETRSARYGVASLGNQAFSEQDFNILGLVDEKGQVLFSRGYDADLDKEIEFPIELVNRLTPGDPLVGVLNSRAGRQGLIATSQGPLLLASAGVVGNDSGRAVNGVVVIGKLLNENQIYRLNQVLQLNIQFLPIRTPLPDADQAALQNLQNGADFYSRPIDSETIAGYTLLEDANDLPVYLLKIELPRTTHREGEFVANYLMIAMILAAFVLGVTFFFSLDRLVLYRVKRLGNEITTIADSGDLSKRVTVARRDELSQLTMTINQMLAAFEKNNAELQVLSRQLVAIQETERRQIALELHDEIGQYLTGLKLLLEGSDTLAEPARTQRLQQAGRLVNELIGRVRELSLDLRPAMLDDFGLVPALLWLFERYESQTRVQVLFQNRLPEGERYDPEVETAAFRTIQEALTNIARHAQTNEAEVTLWRSAEALEIKIEDQGQGFELEKVLDEQHSSGLIGMRERVGLLGGSLNIETAPGQGTSLSIVFPLAEERGK